MIKSILILFFALGNVRNALAQDSIRLENNYLKGWYKTKKDTMPFRFLNPSKIQNNKKYPLIIFLHGSGERGNDNFKQLKHGSKLFLDSSSRYEYYVLFPQCDTNETWSNVKRNAQNILEQVTLKQTLSEHTLLKLIKWFIKTNKVDVNRIYIGGLSLGGMGTYAAIGHNPKLFAAAFPICGSSDTNFIKHNIPHLPIWIFHGDKDKAVDVQYSRNIYNALKPLNKKAIYTEYANVGHDSWNNAFAEPTLFKWLMQQNRKKNKRIR
jgi:predicted peptidase